MARSAPRQAAAALPEWIQRQLTKLVQEAPDGPDWLHEIKFDSYAYTLMGWSSPYRPCSVQRYPGSVNLEPVTVKTTACVNQLLAAGVLEVVASRLSPFAFRPADGPSVRARRAEPLEFAGC